MRRGVHSIGKTDWTEEVAGFACVIHTLQLYMNCEKVHSELSVQMELPRKSGNVINYGGDRCKFSFNKGNYIP